MRSTTNSVMGIGVFLRIVENLLNSDKAIEGLEKLAKGRYPNLQTNMAHGSISF